MDGRRSVLVILLFAEIVLLAGVVSAELETNGSDTSNLPAELGVFKYFFQGSPGKDGRDGRDGRDGHDGAPGPRGSPGTVCRASETVGRPGLKGEQGRDGQRGQLGSQGVPGKVGPQGLRGLPGPQGPAGQIGVPGSTPDISGAIYIRWGRSTCPSTADMVYNGFAGGSMFDVLGGGANYLCLPSTPEYDDEYRSGQNNLGSYVYGAEYDTYSFPPLVSKHDHEVPCAVCEAGNRISRLMIPAKKSCPTGWTQEYYGYLMTASAHNGHKRTEYVCMDRNPESYLRGSSGNENGALFYPVEGTCSPAMACPPYEHGRELSCAVCTK